MWCIRFSMNCWAARSRRKIDAKEAARINLVSKVVAQDKLDEAVSAMAKDIAVAPRDNLLRSKTKILTRAGIAGQTTLNL